ncbi:MAG: hypothetical protein J0I06_23210 [Planctomycetes bacterium]|nr:hypothetical protein [Planctomycetota bacterium]
MASKRGEYPNLHWLCSAYFHQDWGMDDPTADDVICRYIRDTDPQEVRQTADEISAFLRIEMTENERKAILDGLGCECYPRGEGLTYSSWLQRMHALLTAK